MYEKEISEALTELSKISSLLMKLKFSLNEMTTDGAGNIFGAETYSNSFSDLCQSIVDSQFNRKYTSADRIEEETMLIDMPGVSVGSTPRTDGRFQGYVILKNQKNYVYGKTRKEVVLKIKKLLENGPARTKRKKKTTTSTVPTTFNKFAMYYFETFRKKKVAQDTFYKDFNRYKNHILPAFKEKPLKLITPGDCQNLIDKISEKGLAKTTDEVYSLLSVIFKCAILHGLIKFNPLNIVLHRTHERNHGKAFSEEELKTILNSITDEKTKFTFLFMLMTGLRPGEVPTARIEGDFIVAVNSKRKNQKLEYKKIPIFDELRQIIKNPLDLISTKIISKIIKKILPQHKLYDLRTTFYSRCKECGVEEPALKEFVGHSNGALGNAYTSLSDKYLIEQGKKIRFFLTKTDI